MLRFFSVKHDSVEISSDDIVLLSVKFFTTQKLSLTHFFRPFVGHSTANKKVSQCNQGYFFIIRLMLSFQILISITITLSGFYHTNIPCYLQLLSAYSRNAIKFECLDFAYNFQCFWSSIYVEGGTLSYKQIGQIRDYSFVLNVIVTRNQISPSQH